MKKELWVITYDDIDNEYTSTGIEGVFTGTQDEVIAFCQKLNEKHDNYIYSYYIAELLNSKRKSSKFITWLRDWIATFLW